jgi:hypothetical protein
MQRGPLDWGVRMAPGGFADHQCVDGESFCMIFVELVSGGLVILQKKGVICQIWILVFVLCIFC